MVCRHKDCCQQATIVLFGQYEGTSAATVVCDLHAQISMESSPHAKFWKYVDELSTPFDGNWYAPDETGWRQVC